MKYITKSVIFGRKKRESPEDEDYPFFISLYSKNNAYKTGDVPDEILEFPKIDKVVVKGLDFNYLLRGNDIIINDLEEIDIEKANSNVYITGIQKNF
jgi:hypothetical protein